MIKRPDAETQIVPRTTEAPAARNVAASTFDAREEAAYALGVTAFLWGYPLAEYGRTLPNAVKADAVGWNTFRKFTTLKTAADRFVVTPNNVTIDAYAAYDVGREPVVIFVPKLEKERWYLVQLGDHFDEVFHNIGGTKGQQPGVYVITGPDFCGSVPGEMTRLRTRTRVGLAAVRIFVQGDADLPDAVDAQRGFQIMPLSAYLRHGLTYQPPRRGQLAAATQETPRALRYFERLGYWMRKWLAVSRDSADPLVASFRQIGLSVARGFEWRELDDATTRGLARAAVAGDKIVAAAWAATGETTNGWRYTLAGGRAGHDLALRAALAKYVIGAQLSDQVIYPNTSVDEAGRALTGESRYVLHFEHGQQPAALVFWNLAMYGPDMMFVENEIHRYSIGSTTDGLIENDDGSLTLHIQQERPAPDKVANWLPAPAGPFNMTMRFYGPRTSVLDGSYRLPPVTRVD
jgi:hypothetical protein